MTLLGADWEWSSVDVDALTTGGKLATLLNTRMKALSQFLKKVPRYAPQSWERNVVAPWYPFGFVERYGAIGDGVRDDSAAIQYALDSVPDTGGDVFLSQPRYTIATGVSINKPSTRIRAVGGATARNLSTNTVHAASALVGTTSAMTILRLSGVDDDGITIMQAGPILENIAFVDGLAESGGNPGDMTGLLIRIANRWAAMNCGFYYCATGLLATKDSTADTNEDCANWLIQKPSVQGCTIGMDLNTYTGTVETPWVTKCKTGIVVDKKIVNQACSNIEIRDAKIDIVDPDVTAAYAPGVGIQVGAVQGLRLNGGAAESQPNTSDTFGTTAILIDGDSTNTRVSVSDWTFSNVDKGIDCQVARRLHVENCYGRTRAIAVVVDSMIALDDVAEVTIVAGKSDTASQPPITLTANTARASIIGFFGDVIGTTTVTDTPVQIWRSGSCVSNMPVSGGLILREHAVAPSAPAANRGILYTIDNGAGKTELRVLFHSGASQLLATEP